MPPAASQRDRVAWLRLNCVPKALPRRRLHVKTAVFDPDLLDVIKERKGCNGDAWLRAAVHVQRVDAAQVDKSGIGNARLRAVLHVKRVDAAQSSVAGGASASPRAAAKATSTRHRRLTGGSGTTGASGKYSQVRPPASVAARQVAAWATHPTAAPAAQASPQKATPLQVAQRSAVTATQLARVQGASCI